MLIFDRYLNENQLKNLPSGIFDKNTQLQLLCDYFSSIAKWRQDRWGITDYLETLFYTTRANLVAVVTVSRLTQVGELSHFGSPTRCVRIFVILGTKAQIYVAKAE